MKISKWDKPFPINSVCRMDILQAFAGKQLNQDTIKKSVGKITDAEMKLIARKLAVDYCDQLFWESLYNISMDLVVR